MSSHLLGVRRTPAVPNKPVVLLAMCLGQFMVQLDLTIVNVALPSIGRDLGGSVADLQWVIDGYSVALASLLLSGGRAGDRYGHRRVYLVGLSLFAAGSALCAAAPSGGWLTAFRVLQGVGGAIELPATLAILTHTFTGTRERAQAVGIWAGAAGSSLIVGPVLGGALIAGFGWPAVFLVNVPIAAAIAALTRATVVDAVERRGGTSDVAGQVLGAAALTATVAGIIEGGHRGFAAASALVLLGAGVACAAAFIAVERRSCDPMIQLGLFADRGYAAANAAGVAMGFVTVGLLFVLALFFQQAQGRSAVDAGLRFLPFTVAFVVAGPLVGRAVDRVGHRLPMATGCGLMAAGCLSLRGVEAGSGFGAVWWPLALVGVGYGLTSTPMAAVVLGAVPADRAGMASSTNLTARVAGGVLGVAVLGALLPSAATGRSFVTGMHLALSVAAVVAAVAAALVARLVPPGRASN